MADILLYDRNGKGLAFAKASVANGGMLTQDAGARFDEAVDRGNVFVIANQSTVVTQANLSVTTPALTIANRVGSGKVVKLWYAGCQSLVAWTAAAAVWLAQGSHAATAVVETTAATSRNAKTGDPGAPAGVGFLAVATLPTTPVAVGLLGAGLTGLITTVPGIVPFGRWYDGALRLPAGFNWSIQTSTAGTLFCEFIVEVVDA